MSDRTRFDTSPDIDDDIAQPPGSGVGFAAPGIEKIAIGATALAMPGLLVEIKCTALLP